MKPRSDQHEQDEGLGSGDLAGGVVPLETGPDPDDDGADYERPLGDPFALALGCDLLPHSPGIPGCWASVRCDCGRSFKLDLLSAGRKPCPGCRLAYSHVLLVAPAEDTEITSAFLDAIDDEPGDDEPDAG